MTDPSEPDDLAAILAPPTIPQSPALHGAILARTERILRRRRLAGKLVKAGAIAAVFLAGIGFGRHSSRGTEVPVPAVAQVIVVPVVVPVPIVETGSTEPIARTEPMSAGAAELLAEQADDRGEAARLYRLAGDQYLNDVQDYRNAARCYRLYLGRAGDAALSPNTADTWLLTSLKNAAFKEKFDVAKTDG